MVKVCSHCTAEYWSRWRNEPVSLCRDCRDDAVLCVACGAMRTPPPDRAQLALFPLYFGERRRVHASSPAEHYEAPPRVASQKAKRKYPYQ